MAGAWAVAGAVSAQSTAPASTQGPSSAPAGANTPTTQSAATQVVVKGKRAEVTDRIDRRVYNIASDPQSQTGTAADILGKLPSVQVTATGKVTLRGDPGVTVMIDGKIPAAGATIIQSLAASDIDRIEVMTNPSAQYAPDGTAGIINIITKKKHPLGLSGNLSARASSMGEVLTAGALVFTKGPWSIDSRLRYFRSSLGGDTAYQRTAPDVLTQTGRWRDHGENLLGDLNVAYKLNDRSTLTLEGEAYSTHSKAVDEGDYQSTAATYHSVKPASFSRDQSDIEGVYDYNSEKTGAHFTLDGDHSNTDLVQRNKETDTYAGGAQAIYGSRSHTRGPEDDVKGDYERDLSDGREITAGFEFDNHTSRIDRVVFNTGTISGPEADGFTHDFLGKRSIDSAYATYQFPIGKWTFLPGLRVEQQRLDVVSGGLSASQNLVSLYPSLHINRNLSATAKLKFSYSRRVQRPDISEYDPGIIQSNPFSRQTGNPALKPSDTDSFEVGYSDTKKTRNTDITLFYRVTHDLQNTENVAGTDGVVIIRPVNAGTAHYGGLDLTHKAPFGTSRWKYSLNATLNAARVPQLSGADRSFFSYVGNGILEYDAAKGDQFQIAAAVTGRQYEVDGYTGGTSHVDATWQHPLNKKVSLVITASDLFRGNRTVTVVDTPGVASRYRNQPNDQVVRVALSWKFGGKK
jgi:outer membrane receptor protein involved in Fe transport